MRFRRTFSTGRALALWAVAVVLGACGATSPAPSPSPASQQPPARATQANIAAYEAVTARVEPVAESVCRSFHADKPPLFCDFHITLINDPSQPPNAYQTVDKNGRPILAFNINMIKSIRNDDEIAFILGHEAGHQIATHLIQTRQNATIGGILGGILVAAAGGDAQAGVNLGTDLGVRTYSKSFELEADVIGTHIAARAGYDPASGAKVFERTGGGGGFLSTHPPSPERIETVNRTWAEIKAARAEGRNAPIVW